MEDYVRRLRVIFDQILPGVADDIINIKDSYFRLDYLDNLQKTAYELVGKQDKYTEDDVTTNFDETYKIIKEGLLDK